MTRGQKEIQMIGDEETVVTALVMTRATIRATKEKSKGNHKHKAKLFKTVLSRIPGIGIMLSNILLPCVVVLSSAVSAHPVVPTDT